MKTGSFEYLYLAVFALAVTARVFGVSRAVRQERPGFAWSLDSVLAALQGLGLFVLPFVYVFSPWLDFANYPLEGLVRSMGAVIYVIGVWLLWLSHRDLGRCWSPGIEPAPEHRLITHGVYRWIRHPMYAAHLLLGIGQAFLLANWVAGPSFLLLQLPLYYQRIPAEEHRLRERFGRAYEDYMARTGRFLPRF